MIAGLHVFHAIWVILTGDAMLVQSYCCCCHYGRCLPAVLQASGRVPVACLVVVALTQPVHYASAG